jgi:hypothetical protein
MALPNGGGGYQVGDGNLDEPLIDTIPAPVTATTTTTFTAAQLLNGLMLLNSGITANVAYTLPTVAQLEADLTNSDKVGTSFTFRVVNLGTSSGTATITTNTGWTLPATSGSLTFAIPITTGALFVARKSGPGAWTLWRVA